MGGIPSPTSLMALDEWSSRLFQPAPPPAPQVLRISLIGSSSNVLTGAIWEKWEEDFLYNQSPGLPRTLSRSWVSTTHTHTDTHRHAHACTPTRSRAHALTHALTHTPNHDQVSTSILFISKCISRLVFLHCHTVTTT